MHDMAEMDRLLNPWQRFGASVFTWLIVVGATIVCSVLMSIPLWLLTMLFARKTRSFVHWSAVLWARLILCLNPLWTLNIDGYRNLDRKKPYVLVANHQSMLDIVIALAGIPAHFKFMAKKELFPIPFMGWHMYLAGYIPIDRGNRDSAKAALTMTREWFRRGVSVLFFPEGTRSPDGQIQTFKTGAFKLAAEEDMEIVPIVIDGTGDVTPKHSWRVQKAIAFSISIGKPRRVASVDPKDIENAREEIRADMKERLKAIRERSLKRAKKIKGSKHKAHCCEGLNA